MMVAMSAITTFLLGTKEDWNIKQDSHLPTKAIANRTEDWRIQKEAALNW